MMGKIRRARHSSRWPMIILAVFLCIGLVIPLTTLPSSQGNQGQQQAVDVDALRARIDNLKAAMQISPENADLIIQLGNTQYDLGRVLDSKGLFQESAEQFSLAVKTYQKALAVVPDNLDVIVDMATAAFFSDDKDTAKSAFEKAIALDPQHLIARYNYGVFLLQAMGDNKGAVEQWEAALAAQPDAATAQILQELINAYRDKEGNK
ncbi:MAG: tetratricopeptide repeat protein [Bacillota bacterium]